MSDPNKEPNVKQELFFGQMSKLLEKLIDNVKKLKDASSKSIAEAEFDALQHKQQEMIGELVEMDKLVKDHALPVPSQMQKKVQAQLLEFQKMNKEYVDNLRARLSMIQFSAPNKLKKDKPPQDE